MACEHDVEHPCRMAWPIAWLMAWPMAWLMAWPMAWLMAWPMAWSGWLWSAVRLMSDWLRSGWLVERLSGC